ncbi:MarR family transcriptional regulator [Natrarchaeobius oligotrophus]|uniref:MarR family transcriptional regulator n=1 Tax=Natrarchaeobius chitinivorans TaxID=1679083 RepID=A0A3N6MAG5_NATCH|nr:MarR family transcriptional regulator [Natrarchaeobius chitinivorans]RQH00739.1 MarR family transcriptional regulator [Natrarchaeobius chitinivorans]
MAEGQLATDQIGVLPSELDSPQGKLVYLYLDATEGATVSDLNQTLAMSKLSILSVLNSLTSEELVEKRGREYVVVG